MSDVEVQSLALPAVVDLDALDSVRDDLLELVSRGPVEVDASGVERVATNALIMLLSAAETARRGDYAFRVATPSAPMAAAIARLGLDAGFEPILKG